jgi:hypothetical protein
VTLIPRGWLDQSRRSYSSLFAGRKGQVRQFRLARKTKSRQSIRPCCRLTVEISPRHWRTERGGRAVMQYVGTYCSVQCMAVGKAGARRSEGFAKRFQAIRGEVPARHNPDVGMSRHGLLNSCPPDRAHGPCKANLKEPKTFCLEPAGAGKRAGWERVTGPARLSLFSQSMGIPSARLLSSMAGEVRAVMHFADGAAVYE